MTTAKALAAKLKPRSEALMALRERTQQGLATNTSPAGRAAHSLMPNPLAEYKTEPRSA